MSTSELRAGEQHTAETKAEALEEASLSAESAPSCDDPGAEELQDNQDGIAGTEVLRTAGAGSNRAFGSSFAITRAKAGPSPDHTCR